MGSVGAAELLFVLALFLASFVFWIWTIVDCATKEPTAGKDKIVWILIILFTYVLGALIYYFARRRPRRLAEWKRRSLVRPAP